MEDLWAFNEEAVADAIYRCNTPIVSAVGHETDFTIADFTADLRAPTPSAAAELCVPELDSLKEQIFRLDTQMRRNVQKFIAERRTKLDGLTASQAMAKPEHLIAMSRQRLDVATERLQEVMNQELFAHKEHLQRLSETLQALSPYSVLERGYTIARTQYGDTIDSAKELSAGDRAELIFHDGSAGITIESIDLKRG